MRRRRILRESRLANMAVGATMLIIPASAAAALAGPTGGAPARSTTATASISPPRTAVAHRLHVRRHPFNVLGGQRITVRGRLAPAAPWRRVRLQGLQAGRWMTLSSSQTGIHGGFSVRYVPQSTGRQRLRVLAGGGRGTPAVSTLAGMLTVYRESVASWYQDAGGTACGFHSYYGVANRTLPCGSRVTFVRGGRSVTAVVDDRGPYVDGREWDLNQNTAGALAFDGVGTVWSSG